MLARLEGLNTELGREGVAPIRIGVGLHSGEAVIGHVGSALRHEYTAIGDVVNTASRLEGLTKTAGYAVVCSQLVRARLSEEGFSDLGERPLKGRTPLRVFGWNGSRVATPDAGLRGTP
jgi:adenylate cyclase